MNYFGTDLQSHGHYFWKLGNDRMAKSVIWFDDLPFNPEQLPGYEPRKGSIVFFNHAGYTILGISGSCVDQRLGTQSVFWIEGKLTFDGMKELILSIPIAEKIIKQMPFEVHWNN